MRLLTIIPILFLFSVVAAERRVRGKKLVQRKLEKYPPLQNGVPVVSIHHKVGIFDTSLKDKIESAGDNPIDPVDSDTNDEEKDNDYAGDSPKDPVDSNTNDEETNNNDEEKDTDYASSGDKKSGAASRKGGKKGKKGGEKKKSSNKSTMVNSGKKGFNGKKGGKKGNTRSHPMTPAPNPQEPTSAPVSSPADFSFVEFGSYEQLPRNEGCGDFFSFSAEVDALQGNIVESLSDGTASDVLIEFSSLNSSELVWYGFGIGSLIISRDGVIGFGRVDEGELEISGFVAVALLDEFSYSPGANDSARVYYAEGDTHRIVSWENMPVENQDIIVNFQVLFFYNGDIEIKWGMASGIENNSSLVFNSAIVSDSFFLDDLILAERNVVSAWPTNQCSRFNLVKPE